MTRRDLQWRAAGGLLFFGGCAGPQLSAEGSAWVILHFFAAMTGIVLMANGKRVAVVLKAERSGHCATATAVHQGRTRRRR
jgi:hypothetical protein